MPLTTSEFFSVLIKLGLLGISESLDGFLNKPDLDNFKNSCLSRRI